MKGFKMAYPVQYKKQKLNRHKAFTDKECNNVEDIQASKYVRPSVVL
jgi:hypothetical protein